jgi:hypothetical protein
MRFLVRIGSVGVRTCGTYAFAALSLSMITASLGVLAALTALAA